MEWASDDVRISASRAHTLMHTYFQYLARQELRGQIIVR
jgi:hypothetical protein